MCQFLSAVVSKNGEVYCNPFIDSHEEIMQYFNLRDDTSQFINNIVRVEFTPKDDDYFDVENYQLRVGENSIPDWWAEQEISVRQHLIDRIKRMVVDKAENKVLCGGVYFVRDSKILWTKQVRMLTKKNSTVNEMWGNSTVNKMWGNSTVNKMRENSTVNEMRGNSTVNKMWGNSTVNEMWENSTVNEMWENSTVNEMWGNYTVNEMRGNYTVN